MINMSPDSDCLLKGGIDKNMQPIYIFIGNKINKANSKPVAQKLNSYLTTIKPFKSYVWVYCTLRNEPIKLDDIEHLMKAIGKSLFKRNVNEQQMQRLHKLLIISSSIQNSQVVKVIPASSCKHYKEKMHILTSLSELEAHDIQLHQSITQYIAAGKQLVPEQPFYGRDISQYPIAFSGIPVFLDEILSYFKQHEDFLRTEGVFRIPGSTEKETQLLERLKHQEYQAFHEFPPEVVATILKNTLVNLREPIFPFEIYDTLVKDVKTDTNNLKDENLCELFQTFFAYMNPVNRQTVKKLAEFLHHVAEYEQQNKMGLENLSIVFTPCFFRPQGLGNEADLMGARKVVKYFHWLIQNVDRFLGKQQLNGVQ